MRILTIYILIHLITSTTWSQTGTITNSFNERYKRSNPTINYSYDSDKKIHNYSDNWDFDKDGKPDEVYFIGTGGVHLYYFLRIKLSSDNIVRNYKDIQTDLPILPITSETTQFEFNPIISNSQFAVFDYDKDNNSSIFIRLDNVTIQSNKKAIREKGIKTNFVLISYKNGKIIFRDIKKK